MGRPGFVRPLTGTLQARRRTIVQKGSFDEELLRRYMRAFSFAFALTLAAVGLADTIVMKDGRAIRGTYLGGSPRQVKIEIGDQIQTLDVGDISRIEFSQPAASTPNLPPPQSAPTRNELVSPPPSADLAVAPPPSYGIQLSAGTNIVVRTIDGIDSE